MKTLKKEIRLWLISVLLKWAMNLIRKEDLEDRAIDSPLTICVGNKLYFNLK